MDEPTNADALPAELEERIYQIHFDGDPAERSAALAELCAAHPQHAHLLRQRAAALIRSDRLFGRVRQQLDEPTDSERIGPYAVQRVLGRGGFGTVYLAQQTAPVRRDVALKVLQRGRVDTRSMQRFEDERQVLARLQHACIAQIYDAGKTDAGMPWFAMEYVPGVPVTTWCDRAQLDIAGRLRLFLRICRAIQHAHQRGVVHRDIKPSNVLVREEDGRPLPKVIDFGVAKLMRADDDLAALRTREGGPIGTPGYMSPEQAAGEPIDTRADVYALGVLLCELLTGDLPFSRRRLQDCSMATLTRLLLDQDPPRPSALLQQDAAAAASAAAARGTTAAGLARALRADLDWVALKALARDPDARYASVAALADDIDRYLRDEPVSVRERAAAYLLRKFVARHRISVGVAGVLLGTLLAGVIGLAWTLGAVDLARREAVASGNEAERQRDAALDNAYAAGVAAAQLAIQAGDVRTAVEHLAGTDAGRRGWEWRYLAAQADHAQQVIPLERELLDLAWIDRDRLLGFERTGDIGVWSLASGRRERALAGRGGEYRSFAIDRSRGRLVVATSGSVDLFDYASGRHQRQLLAAPHGVWAVALSTDGNRLAVGGQDGQLDLVRFDRDFATARLPDRPATVTALAFLGNDELLVGLESGTIQRLAADTGAPRAEFAAHQDIIDDLLVDADRRLLYSASIDTTVRVFGLATGELRVVLPGQVRMRRLALSPDGSVLFAGGGWADNRIQAWDTATFALLGRFHGHRGGAAGLGLDPTGERLATSGSDGTLRIWSSAPPSPRRRLDAGRDARQLSVDAAGRRFAVASRDGLVSVWDAASLEPVLRRRTRQGWAGSALGRDVVYTGGGSVAAFSLATGEQVAAGPAPHYVEKLAVDPSERWLVGGWGDRLMIWQLPELELRHVLELPVGTGQVVFDAAADRFVQGGSDATLRWIDPGNGIVTDALRLDDQERTVGGLLCRGDVLLAGLHGGTVLLRHGDQPMRRIATSGIAVALAADGGRVVTGGSDQAVRLWDAAGTRQLLVLGGMDYSVEDAHFVAGGTRLIALSARMNSPAAVFVWTAPPVASLPW